MHPAVDEAKLNEFLGKVINDIGAAMSAPLARIGDRLGLYRALAAEGPIASGDLASRTETNGRYIEEWLHNQVAGGYVSVDAASGKYFLSPEQACLLADEASPFFMGGAFQVISSVARDDERMAENFRSGKGMAWGEHHPALFEGTERFFRPNYSANLVSSWIPSLEGVREKLESGADVADVGCGHGASTIIMGKAFPKSRFAGFDYHESSVKIARERARAEQVTYHVKFERSGADNFPGSYDFITFFDCLHDMADPVRALGHVRKALKPGGSCMIVEPYASDNAEENMNPIGRVFYAASTLICVPCSFAGNGPGLGAQAGESKTKEIAAKAGFGSFRRAAQTPFSLVYEARP